MALKQEFTEQDSHRIVDTETQETSNWATYTQIVFFKGVVSATTYYLNEEGIVSPEEFCRQIAVR